MAPLHIRDITNSAYICNTLQCSKNRNFIFLVCHNSAQNANVWKSQSTRKGAFVQEGRCPRGHLSGGKGALVRERGVRPDTCDNMLTTSATLSMPQ